MFLEQKEEIYERVQLKTQDDKIAFLKAINNYLYKEIYDFAGKFRSYDFAGQSNDNPHYFIQPVKLEDFDFAFDEVSKVLIKIIMKDVPMKKRLPYSL